MGVEALDMWNLILEVTFQNYSSFRDRLFQVHSLAKNVTKARKQPLGFSEVENTSCLGTYMHAAVQSGPHSCPVLVQALWGMGPGG